MTILSLKVHFLGPYNCNITCRAARVVLDTAAIFRYAMDGSLEKIRRLLEEGEASPYDVDETNESSALVYAVDSGHVDVWRYLLKVGADPCHQSKMKQYAETIASYAQ